MDADTLHREKERLKAALEFITNAGVRRAAALEALQGQLDLLQQMGGSEIFFAREVAKLDACMHLARAAEDSENAFTLRYAIDDLAFNLKQSAETLTSRIDALAETANTTTQRLADRIGGLTKTTDDGTRLLSRWTFWLAVATALLVIAALVQAYVMATAAPQVVIMPVLKP